MERTTMRLNNTRMAMVGMLVTLANTPAAAQSHEAMSLGAQRRGMKVVHRGIEAIGGLKAIRHAETARLDAVVSGFTLGQAARPGVMPSAGGSPTYVSHTLDRLSGQRLYEFFASDTATVPLSRAVYTEDAIVLHAIGPNTVQEVDREFADAFLRQLAYVPDILLEVLDRPAGVRWIGNADRDGDRHLRERARQATNTFLQRTIGATRTI